MSTSDPGTGRRYSPGWYPDSHTLADQLAAIADALRAAECVTADFHYNHNIQISQRGDLTADERRAVVDTLARALGDNQLAHHEDMPNGHRHYVARLEPTFPGTLFTPVPDACLWLGGCENDRQLSGRDPQLCAEHNAQIEGKP